MKAVLAAVAASVVGAVAVPVVAVMVLTGPPAGPVAAAMAHAGSSSTVSCALPVGQVKSPAITAGRLSEKQVTDLAIAAGWRGADVAIAVAVARAESDWKPTATLLNTNGSTDHGLWQINSVHAAILAAGNWRDPADNAAMAFKVWKESGGRWRPWVTYNTGSYRKFLHATASPAPAAGCTPQIGDGTGSCKIVKGNWPNGQIPAGALCTIKFDKRHKLRADAANALVRLNVAYRAHFGHNLCFTDSYRSLDAQISVRARKGNLAAIPGTSNHGWGLAIDGCEFGGRPWIVGSDLDVWMHENAPKYGWVHPGWAEPHGSKPEPWHWGYLDGVHAP